MTQTYRVVLIGFGSVGQGFAQIVQQKGKQLQEQQGVNIQIVGVATRSWCSYDPYGLNLDTLLQAYESRDLTNLPSCQPWNPNDLIAHAEADILVEVSSTDLSTAEPATSYIRAAFERGMHVVTANKGPVALHGPELRRIAYEKGLRFGYEATVMAGTPCIRLGWSALAGCDIRELRGIVNGTTNYILTQMESGMSYEAALAEAQKLGYAETDPTGDVEGHDAAGKAAILATMLMSGALMPDNVEREGITKLTVEDVAEARAAGERWKLVAQVTRTATGITASVRPTRLPLTHPLSSVSGPTNALTYTTDLLGDVTIIGPGAGGIATGFALLSDVLALR